MKKFFLLLLMTVSLYSCGLKRDKVVYYWHVRNKSSQPIIVKLMEVEDVYWGNYHTVVTNIATNHTFHIEIEDYNQGDCGWDMYWRSIEHGGNQIQCEIWTGDNNRLLKRWTLSELENGGVESDEIHFFRESDWTRVQAYKSGSVEWYFYITDELLNSNQTID